MKKTDKLIRKTDLIFIHIFYIHKIEDHLYQTTGWSSTFVKLQIRHIDTTFIWTVDSLIKKG